MELQNMIWENHLEKSAGEFSKVTHKIAADVTLYSDDQELMQQWLQNGDDGHDGGWMGLPCGPICCRCDTQTLLYTPSVRQMQCTMYPILSTQTTPSSIVSY